MMSRDPQPIGIFEPGDPQRGYYTDLRKDAQCHGSPEAAIAALARMTAERKLANPVSITQLGLGAWALGQSDASWLGVTEDVCRWLLDELDQWGRLAYQFPMPHTYELEPPWYSAMAQGEAVSLFVRAAEALREHRFADAVDRAVLSLLDPRLGLVVETPEGPVLQEYPTTPPSHVLNGWIFALWGLYDVSLGRSFRAGEAGRAFEEGSAALARRLPLYEASLGWSRYDLFPHPIVNVASPFYHRVHVEQLRAMAALRPDCGVFSVVAERWGRATDHPVSRSLALTRKVAFRLIRPRGRAA